MKSWGQALADSAVTGTLASLGSMAVLALRGRRDSGSALAPLNAPSHWIHGDKALRQDGASLRYTGTGVVVHHLSAMMWGVLHEKLFGERRGGREPVRSAARLLRDSAATTAIAAIVDLKLVPHRLTPGFEHRLSRASLAGVYGAFALGLFAGSWLLAQRH